MDDMRVGSVYGGADQGADLGIGKRRERKPKKPEPRDDEGEDRYEPAGAGDEAAGDE